MRGFDPLVNAALLSFGATQSLFFTAHLLTASMSFCQ